jgi:hypothetical protein
MHQARRKIKMKFERAFKFMMQSGEKIKLPSWGGYWYWDNEKKTVIMHTKDGKEMDIRETERVIYTLSNILDDGWILADEENCPELGGEATFGFDEAIKYLKRGMKLARKGWNGKGIFIHLCETDATTNPFVCIDSSNLQTDNLDAKKNIVPWAPSQTDMLADDWVFFE